MGTVLVVDDTKADRELIGRAVIETGNEVIYASDGSDALIAAKRYKPELILMDVVMPRMSGFDACRKLKNDPETAAIAVVLVSTHQSPSDRFWGKKQGADDILSKPVTAVDLLDILRRVVRKP